MSTLKQLLDQKAALEREIESTRRQEKTEAVAKVKALMTEYGLSMSDLSTKGAPRAQSASPNPSSGKGGKVAAKFIKQDTGETWSGRGLQPKWRKAAIASVRKLEDFPV